MGSKLRSLVRAYHRKMHPDHLGHGPLDIPADLWAFRRRLDHEEHREVVTAWDELDHLTRDTRRRGARPDPELVLVKLAALLHELADRTIVAYGTSDCSGVDFDEVLETVMAANMNKEPPTVPGGKATKPPGWQSAELAVLDIVRQAALQREQDIERAGRTRQDEAVAPAVDQFAAPVRPPVDVAAVARQALDIGPLFTAAYSSTCGECGDEIEEGEPARMVDGEAEHDQCAADQVGEYLAEERAERAAEMEST